MSSADHTIRQHDTKPFISTTLINPDGSPVDLTNSTVLFEMKSQVQPTVFVSGSATIVNAVAGQVSYHWQPNDTSIAGWYNGVFQVTDNASNIETFPNSTFLTIEVFPAL